MRVPLSAMRFSIIIPAFNSAPELQVSLPALVAASGPEDEIFVVDDGSTDETAHVASTLGVEVLPLVRNLGPAGARNHGATNARGRWLLFVDSDVVVQDGVLEQMEQVFKAEPKISAVFGSYDDNPTAAGLVSRYRNLLHHFVHQQGNREAGTFWAGLGAVRRDVFLEVGGFDAERFPHSSIEDIELGYRLRKAGYRIRLDPTLQGSHLKGWTFWSMIRTDIVHRALPWARLTLQSGNAVNDLNLRASQRWSALLLGLAVVAAFIAVVQPGLWGLVPAALAGVFVLNWRFYGLLRQQGGLSLAIGGTLLHWLYFLYSGLSFLFAYVEWALREAVSLSKGPETRRP